MDARNEDILKALEATSGMKQHIYRTTLDTFLQFRKQIESISAEISPAIELKDPSIEISVRNNGDFETELKFSGDTLLFMMHTNVFAFPADSEVFKLDYVKQDNDRAYCGMILIYNFLSDSIKYNRMNDVGYLIARIFINKEGHFFIQGKRQFSFLYNDFSAFEINEEVIRQIVQTCILQTIDFDLYVPPFDQIKEVTVMEKVIQRGSSTLKTGKRLGFTQQTKPSA